MANTVKFVNYWILLFHIFKIQKTNIFKTFGFNKLFYYTYFCFIYVYVWLRNSTSFYPVNTCHHCIISGKQASTQNLCITFYAISLLNRNWCKLIYITQHKDVFIRL